MTKPWEETWLDEGSDGTLVYVDEDDDHIVFGNIPDPDRARLAAAAPEMARALAEAAEMLEEYLQHWEGAPLPSELKTKDVVGRALDALRKAGADP